MRAEYNPGVELFSVHVEVAPVWLAVNVTDGQDTVRPAAVVTVKLTLPAKFSLLANVNTSVVEVPLLMLTSKEAADTVKSPT